MQLGGNCGASTATSVTLADDINPGAGDSLFFGEGFTVFDNALYFMADGGDGTGAELWRFRNGQATPAADINKNPDPNFNGSLPSDLTVFRGYALLQR